MYNSQDKFTPLCSKYYSLLQGAIVNIAFFIPRDVFVYKFATAVVWHPSFEINLTDLRTCCKVLYKLILSFRWRSEPYMSRKRDGFEIAMGDNSSCWFYWINWRLIPRNNYSILFTFCCSVAVSSLFKLTVLFFWKHLFGSPHICLTVIDVISPHLNASKNSVQPKCFGRTRRQEVGFISKP